MIPAELIAIVISGNVARLKLKSTQIMIYAIIFDRSFAGQREYEINMDELMFWTGRTKRTVLKNIQSLKDKGIITINDNGLIYLLK